MIPAFLIRAAIDHVRHSSALSDSNPYSRCEEAVIAVSALAKDKLGDFDENLLEIAVATSYWEEFFHSEDPLPDEKDWREGLAKRSSNYDNFDVWQAWFKDSYKQVYRENNIWMSVLMTAWAHTHQYQLTYNNNKWEFVPSRSYLPTSQMWRLEPHIETIQEIILDCWYKEMRAYTDLGFRIETKSIPYLGKVECLNFDTSENIMHWPARSSKMHNEIIDIGKMVADIVFPVSDSWYRHLDNMIFAFEHLDVTALINRTSYVFESKRHVLELSIENDPAKARHKASAEGWLVDDSELEGPEAGENETSSSLAS